MPTWCHMFNSTLTGNARVCFDKLPKESIDSYEDLRTGIGKTIFSIQRHQGSVGYITSSKEKENFGRLHGIPRSVDEMYRMTTSFLQGEVAALSHGRRERSYPFVNIDGGTPKPNFKKTASKINQRPDHPGHNTNECLQLEKTHSEMDQGRKLSQFIKKLNRLDSESPEKGGERLERINFDYMMIQPWERVAKLRDYTELLPETGNGLSHL
ncbi:hypothetical protein Tco_0377212 [Tanacetum coccineum]